MTNQQFHHAWAEIPNYPDRDAYISDLALSSIWGADPDSDIPAERIDYLGRLWDAAHMDVKSMATAAGITVAALSERTTIPYRTLMSWQAGDRQCPGYVRLLLLHFLGLIPGPW